MVAVGGLVVAVLLGSAALLIQAAVRTEHNAATDERAHSLGRRHPPLFHV